jgi:hypothetical protein
VRTLASGSMNELTTQELMTAQAEADSTLTSLVDALSERADPRRHIRPRRRRRGQVFQQGTRS